MKTLSINLVLTVLLIAAACPCFALVELTDVSTEQAKEMGVTIRSNPNGESGVRVTLEFKTEGVLKNFGHVNLEINSGGKRVVDAQLQVARPTVDSVSVSFSADPNYLAASVLMIVVHDSERTHVGYRLTVKDFIGL